MEFFKNHFYEIIIAIIVMISVPAFIFSSINFFIKRNSNTNETYSQNDSSSSLAPILSHDNSVSAINNLSALVNQSISFGEISYSKTEINHEGNLTDSEINDDGNLTDKEISDEITADSNNSFVLSGTSSENITESNLPDFSASSQDNLSNVTKTGEVEESEINKTSDLELFQENGSNSSKITIASIKNETTITFNNLTTENPNLIQNGKNTVLLENPDYSEIGIPDTLTTENPIFYSMQIEAPSTMERENNISSNIGNLQKEFAIGSFGENISAEEVTEGKRNSIIKEGSIPAKNNNKSRDGLEYGTGCDENSDLCDGSGYDKGSSFVESLDLWENSGLVEGSGLNESLGLVEDSDLNNDFILKNISGLSNSSGFE
ncbi:hypothetical protein DMUE_1753 [Dictyocoela muelleri]|nr:hypothetical protein DMUE_1753 [Dictyocoela muelleri]